MTTEEDVEADAASHQLDLADQTVSGSDATDGSATRSIRHPHVDASVSSPNVVSGAHGESRRDRFKWVTVATPDINGSLRGKAISSKLFVSASDRGIPITDLIFAVDAVDSPQVCDDATSDARHGDVILEPDLRTLAPSPYRPGWAWCLASPRSVDGTPFGLSPRVVCDNAIANLLSLGLEVFGAFEYEFRLYYADSREPVTASQSYSADAISSLQQFVEELHIATTAFGIEIQTVHTEGGAGLVEVTIAPVRGTFIADQAILLRASVARVAAQLGMRASFLAKSQVGEEGSGGHLHVSLLNSRGGNTFVAGKGPSGGLAPCLRAAVGGLLAHLGALSVLYNPHLNSYKRLVPGSFAPVSASWGIDDRSAAVRIIDDSTTGNTHFELRRPGADANPYLVLAGTVAAVSSGLTRESGPGAPATPRHAPGTLPPHVKLPLPHAADDNARPLPGDLGEAIRVFEADVELRNLLGEPFCRRFVATRRWELDAWQRTVTNWELERAATPPLLLR